jgi:hypothetical protein
VPVALVVVKAKRCQPRALPQNKGKISLKILMQLTSEYKNAVSVKLKEFTSQFPDLSLPTENSESLIEGLISRSIRELKHMVDFLAKSFTVSLPAPKRNSKVSLSRWVSQVLSKVVEIEAIAEEIPLESVQPEILEPEIYDICLLGDKSYSRHSVSRLPLYLIESGSLYQKSLFPSPSSIVSYFQVLSQPLSDIEVDSGGVAKVELLCDNLLVSSHDICCIPPLYLIAGNAAFKRMHRELITQNSVIKYCQLSSKRLPDICLASTNKPGK